MGQDVVYPERVAREGHYLCTFLSTRQVLEVGSAVWAAGSRVDFMAMAGDESLLSRCQREEPGSFTFFPPPELHRNRVRLPMWSIGGGSAYLG